MQRLKNVRKILYAIAGAVIIHICILLLLCTFVTYWPGTTHLSDAGSDKKETLLKVTMIPPEPPPYLPTLDRQRTDQAQKEALFQSDKNTEAASETAPTHPEDVDLPSQEGADLPSFDFDTQAYVAGKKASDQAGQGAPSMTMPQQVQEPKNETAKAQPQEVSPDGLQPKTDSQKQNPAQQPPPDKLTQNTPSTPPVSHPGAPGYKPQNIKNHITGGISSRGPSAISARETPLGRYQKALSDAIGSRWYYYAEQRAGLIPVSTVRIHFTVNALGKVQNIRVEDGNPNGSLATMSIEALIEARIPPIPAEVAALLNSNQMDVTFSFAQL